MSDFPEEKFEELFVAVEVLRQRPNVVTGLATHLMPTYSDAVEQGKFQFDHFKIEKVYFLVR